MYHTVLLCRGESSVKVAALNLMAAAVEGLGNNDRNVLTVHAEALKTADKYAKDKYSDNTLRQSPYCNGALLSILDLAVQ
jgi:hypothetical protein